MNKDIKLALNPGVELNPTKTRGIAHATVIDATRRFELTWDRFMRLYNTALAVKQRVPESTKILDIGGYDGALALFLNKYKVDVIDPITTGGSGLNIQDCKYEIVVSVDALEHVPPDDRNRFLQQIAKVTSHQCFINFPARRTGKAQQLVYELTKNPLVKEHVMWELPDGDDVKNWLEKTDFSVDIIRHTSLPQWISQYLLQTMAPEAASITNQYLLNELLNEPVNASLYDLVIGKRCS